MGAALIQSGVEHIFRMNLGMGDNKGAMRPFGNAEPSSVLTAHSNTLQYRITVHRTKTY